MLDECWIESDAPYASAVDEMKLDIQVRIRGVDDSVRFHEFPAVIFKFVLFVPPETFKSAGKRAIVVGKELYAFHSVMRARYPDISKDKIPVGFHLRR